MTNVHKYRRVPDLVEQVADLSKRLKTLEAARRLGNASIDGGELVISAGDVVVRNDDGEMVLRIKHGNTPRIQMFPNQGLGNFYAETLSWESSEGATYQACVLDPSATQAGGKLLLMHGATYLSHQPNDTGAPETYLSLSEKADHPNHFRFEGKFITDRQYSNTDAWLIGTAFTPAGFGAVSIAYDYEFVNAPLVLYTITGATANFNHCLVSSTTAGFTIGWSDALAHTINYIAFRR